ncbi:MAG: fatty acid desaturase [Calditrichaeota bacterium]|nr:fatty acid desaturase [Calditrichota bacterium]
MSENATSAESKKNQPGWYKEISKYAQPDLKKSIWQLINTFVPYFALWISMVYLVQRGTSYWIILGLATVTALLHVRIFIFFHDACHGSFFASRRANKILGYVAGIVTFTPFEEWRRLHNIHHATSGDLDRRGVGDIWTMTVEEYRASSKIKRIAYRVFRNPLVMFGLGPVILFLVSMRIPSKESKKEERRSVIITNIALILIVLGLGFSIGFSVYFKILIPVTFIAGAAGIWLFYVQHQFEDSYWSKNADWDMIKSALKGSSYYKLPKILQWFTGNIGLHHIHHLRPRIPNYYLQSCNDNIPAFSEIKPLTISTSLKSLWLDLWDENKEKLVSFRSLRTDTNLC